MNRKIGKGVVSAIIVVMILFAFFKADNILRFSNNAGLAHAWDYIMNDCEDIDVVFMGTSHCQYSINTKTVNKYLKTKSVLAAWAFQFMGHTYWAAKELIEKKKPEMLVLEVYSLFNLGDFPSKELTQSRPEGVLRTYSIMDFSMNRLNMAVDEFGNIDEALIAAFPALSNHNIWKKENGFAETIEEACRSDKELTGLSSISYMSDETQKAYKEPENITTMKVSQADRSYEYIGKIIELCKANNVKLVLYTAPLVDEVEEYLQFNIEKDKLKKLAETNQNVFFVDYSTNQEELGITQYHYRDEKIGEQGNNHLNYLGSDLISKQMAMDLYEISPKIFPEISSAEDLREKILIDKDNTFDVWMQGVNDDTILLMASAGQIGPCETGGEIPTAKEAFLQCAGLNRKEITAQKYYIGVYMRGKNVYERCRPSVIPMKTFKKGRNLKGVTLQQTLRIRSNKNYARISIGEEVITNQKGGVLMVLYDVRQDKIVKTAIFDPMNSDIQVPEG